MSLGRIAFSPPIATRGGREVAVYHQPVVHGNARLVENAAGRKRLLYARVTGWATGSVRTGTGLMGRAGEQVTRATLSEDDLRHLYAPVMPGYGEAAYLLGEPVPGGPLDSAAYLFAAPGGIPLRPIVIPIEVKNLREWIFPRTPELYQLLWKAAVIQSAHPHDPLAPVLVCHRRHIQTLFMGQDLGFFAVETHRQYMLPSAEAPPEAVEEVRDGLGYRFLTQDLLPDPTLLEVFRRTIPPRATGFASRWLTHGATLANYYALLKDDRLPDDDRETLMDELFLAAMALLNMIGGWRLVAADAGE